MTAEGTAAQKARAPEPDDPRKPDSPTDVRLGGWKFTLKKSFGEFTRDQCPDLAAALTYYAVLALFPGLLAVFSLLGVVGQGPQTATAMLELLSGIAPAETVEQLRAPITSMATSPASGFTFVAGLVGALWSASGYVGAFGRAMNRIYEIDEGRPFWKLRPVMLLLTVIVVIVIAVLLFGLVVSGPVAAQLSEIAGLGSLGLTVFNIVKWPVMLVLAAVLVALLYYATPNIQQPKFRWLSVGSFIALVIWVILSLGFGFYVANFGNYNRTYGTLGGVIIFLLWVWITNNALLFGAEVDSELERARELQAGIEAETTLQLPPRDTRASEKLAKKRDELIAAGRRLREAAARRDEDRVDGPEADDDTDAERPTT
jgi:membrane protein